jgi:hypothetical protein
VMYCSIPQKSSTWVASGVLVFIFLALTDRGIKLMNEVVLQRHFSDVFEK